VAILNNDNKRGGISIYYLWERLIITNLLISFVVFFILMRPDYSKAQELNNTEQTVSKIDEVRIKGNQRIETDAILAVISVEKGVALDYKLLDNDLHDIYRMGYFKDVKIETEDGPHGNIITFHVEEKPFIAKIIFEGNDSTESLDLEKEIGIKIYSILDHNEVRQSINRLKEYYQQKKYYDVEIKNKTIYLPNNEVLLKYIITEHDRVYISKVEILGNKEFDDKKIKSFMETKERGLLSWLTDAGCLDKKKLELDVYKITAFYSNNGFIKAKVGAPKIVYNKDSTLSVIIEISEGHQYKINKVSVAGDFIRTEAELLKILQISKEEVFNREILRQDILLLSNIYSSKGYAYVDITPLIKEDETNFLVDITYQIAKRKKVRFERINISGNTVTRDKVIRRELMVVEGDIFNGMALKRSEGNLNRLGFFENVRIQARDGSKDDLMVLNIDVKERSTGSFSFGAGYSSVDNLIGMFQISKNNFLGRGQQLSSSIQIGGNHNQFDIRFSEPWLFDKPIFGDTRIFKWNREYDDYTKDASGAELTIGTPLKWIDFYVKGWIKYSYEDAKISDIYYYASNIIQDMSGQSKTSSITLGINRNSTNHHWNPTKGSHNSFSFKYAGGIFGGTNYYNKYAIRSTWYFPLSWWEHVFMVQGRAGYLEKRSGGKLPVYEKFFIGGINSVRGFDNDDISPIDPDTGDKIGGEKMMIYNMEYRFHLIKDEGIMGLFFFDAGDVLESGDEFEFKSIRMSAGAGIRWYSPMGPLRLEWGYNLDPIEGEPSSNMEFSIGTIF